MNFFKMYYMEVDVLKNIGGSTRKYFWLFLICGLLISISGCSAPTIADDLLLVGEKNNSPIVNNPVRIYVEINPKINNYQQIDRLVKESLELALTNANIFGIGSGSPYKINANITTASQAAMSFGSFKGTLEIEYALFDDTNNKLFSETIFTEAGSDKWSLSGAERSNRSRAVNISKNVLEFVDILQGELVKE